MDTGTFRSYVERIGDFLTLKNLIPWSEKFSDTTDSNDESESGRMFNLSFPMVTSRRQEVIKSEINLLETCLGNGNNRRVLQQKDRLYLLALGYYKANDYAKSQHLLNQCLLIAPEWEKALALKRIVEQRIVFYGIIGMGITSLAAGLIVGSFAAILAKKN